MLIAQSVDICYCFYVLPGHPGSPNSLIYDLLQKAPVFNVIIADGLR